MYREALVALVSTTRSRSRRPRRCWWASLGTTRPGIRQDVKLRRAGRDPRMIIPITPNRTGRTAIPWKPNAFARVVEIAKLPRSTVCHSILKGRVQVKVDVKHVPSGYSVAAHEVMRADVSQRRFATVVDFLVRLGRAPGTHTLDDRQPART